LDEVQAKIPRRPRTSASLRAAPTPRTAIIRGPSIGAALTMQAAQHARRRREEAAARAAPPYAVPARAWAAGTFGA
jgi:hypothetical protein